MANGHGGSRAGSGRKSTKHEYMDDGLVSPLQFILAVMRDEKATPAARYMAAKDAAPYCSARLVNKQLDIEHDLDIRLISYLEAD